MKKLLILFAIFTTVAATAQSVGINADGSTANTSAMLDVSSTSKGFLPPRMTYAQKTAISSPAAGLMVWCSNCGTSGEIQVYNGSVWTNMIGGATSGAFPSLAATVSASAILSTTAASGGNITSDGGVAVTARGVCWSITTSPTIALGTKTTDGTGTGLFSSSITGLLPNTTYFVRAYATNSSGTAYGSEISFTTLDLAIGDPYQGGKIAYILQPNDPGYIAGQTHGLIAAASDQSAGAQWGCYGTPISGADGTAIGTGNQNTIDIMNGCATAGIAARLCGNLVLGGFSDWYLPSKEELNKLFINLLAVGGFSSDFYWSSSEGGDGNAWDQNFNGGFQGNDGKGNALYVRAVRAF